MKHKTFLIVASTLFLFSTLLGPATAQESGYAPVNGLEMYYEIHGEGQPLVLIHGGLGGTMEFGQLLPMLAETRQVIAVELQGHGRTADIDRPLSYESMADDIAALIDHLGHENADVLGFSLGGGVALQTAIRHPEAVDRMVLISTAYSRSGIHETFLEGMAAMNAEAAAMMLETPMYQFYASVAPQPENWPTLVGKAGDLLRQDYDWSADIDTVTASALVIAGDSDMIPPAHAAELFSLLGGGTSEGFTLFPAPRLAILPETTHFDILSRTDLLLPFITSFLDASS